MHDPSDPRIKVRFASKSGGVVDVPGTFVSKDTIERQTPNFVDLVADSEDEASETAVNVRVAFRDDSFTTTSQEYNFFPVTDAEHCLAYGPGLLDRGSAMNTTMFVINAQDSLGNLRSSGGDLFLVEITEKNNECIVRDIQIDDQENGTYLVQYTPPMASEFTVEIQFKGKFTDVTGAEYNTGKSGHIRGSPFVVHFEDGVSKERNNIEGSLMMEYIKTSYQYARKFTMQAKMQLQKAIDPKYNEGAQNKHKKFCSA